MLAIALEEVVRVGDDLLVGELGERSLAGERQDLPERHGERPDVAATRELALRRRRLEETGETPRGTNVNSHSGQKH